MTRLSRICSCTLPQPGGSLLSELPVEKQDSKFRQYSKIRNLADPRQAVSRGAKKSWVRSRTYLQVWTFFAELGTPAQEK
jgi:hypothetical protein